MLTLWVVGIQYFLAGLFDFHRARAPDRLLDIGKIRGRGFGPSSLDIDLGRRLVVVAAEELNPFDRLTGQPYRSLVLL
jgi:hypothetical protein